MLSTLQSISAGNPRTPCEQAHQLSDSHVTVGKNNRSNAGSARFIGMFALSLSHRTTGILTLRGFKLSTGLPSYITSRPLNGKVTSSELLWPQRVGGICWSLPTSRGFGGASTQDYPDNKVPPIPPSHSHGQTELLSDSPVGTSRLVRVLCRKPTRFRQVALAVRPTTNRVCFSKLCEAGHIRCRTRSYCTLTRCSTSKVGDIVLYSASPSPSSR